MIRISTIIKLKSLRKKRGFLKGCLEKEVKRISDMIRVEIEEVADELTNKVWNFILINNYLVLDSYTLFKRESKRHRKYKPVESYHRLKFQRGMCNIPVSKVPFSDELKERALHKFMKSIKCIKDGNDGK